MASPSAQVEAERTIATNQLRRSQSRHGSNSVLTKSPSAKARRRSEMNLNQRIRHDIERKILSGKWPPGYRIPKEYELMEQYDCSRMTVNKVLSGLAAEGFIQRKRGAGSFVAPSYVQSAVLEIRDVKAEITARGARYDYELITRRRRPVNRADQKLLNIPDGSEVLVLQGRHFSNEHPFAFEDRILNLTAVREAEQEDFSKLSPGTWLLDKVPWTEAEHHISAVNADAAIATLLDIAVGTACLAMERRTWRSGQPITFVRLTFPGPLYHLFAHFTPGA
jgi:GntR family histidine utilization transcriptional repressor